MRNLRFVLNWKSLALISFLFFISNFLFLISHNVASAEVIVYDSVTTSGRTAILKALTKGRFFPEGGRRVEFYIGKRHIGTTLSGGDGYALLKYLPLSKGIKHLKVRSGADSNEGVLLIIEKDERVILTEIEGSLLKSPFSFQPLKGSKDELQRLSWRFRIIYLTTMIGVKKARQWIKENGFPQSAVLRWGGSEMLDELQAQGIRLYAIVGSPSVLSESSEHIKKRFSFKETEEGIVVEDWKDISKRLSSRRL